MPPANTSGYLDNGVVGTIWIPKKRQSRFRSPVALDSSNGIEGRSTGPPDYCKP